ncbi:MAG: hypothetical protein GXZ11_09060 [Tissierellia bacterium]|nr:hypothetical protein [Tissierellia bacterium]
MRGKKLLVLLLALVMVLGTALPSLALSTTEKNQWLIDKGYVKGRYDNGKIDYAFNDSIERDEITKMLVIAGGYEKNIDSYKNKTSIFSDVSQSHWGIGEINLASSLGMIIGYPDGTFKPDNFVTFAELCTMLVRLDARWKNVNASNLTWPQGYINLAEQYGILKDVRAPLADTNATRGLAFEMIYNFINKDSSADKYTVTFDYNVRNIPGYSNSNNNYEKDYNLKTYDVKVKKDEAIGRSNMPANKTVRDRSYSDYRDYSIKEWNTKADGTGYRLYEDTKIKENQKYYAIWSYGSTNYDVRVDTLKITRPVGTSFSSLNLPSEVRVYYYDRDSRIERSGYYRVEWRSADYSANANYTQTIRGDVKGLPSYLSYSNPLAKIEVSRGDYNYGTTTVKFDKNGATGTAPASMTKTAGSKQYLPEKGNMVKTGYKFLGWSYFKSSTTAMSEPITWPSTDTTLYAVWESTTPVVTTYKVSFDLQDGVANPALKPVNVEKGKVIPAASVPAEGQVKKDGYVLTGWRAAGAATNWNFTTDKVTKDTILVAQWRTAKTFKVTFKVDNTNYIIQDVKEGQTANSVNAPDKKGKIFKGWFKGEETTPYNFSTPVTADFTLNAKYEKVGKVTVTFFSDATNEVIDQVKVDKGKPVSKPAAAPDVVGKIFRFWSMNKTTEFDFSTPINDNTMIYAIYDDAVTVTFDSQGVQLLNLKK